MELQPNQFYIKGNVPSSKNGRRCMCNVRAKKRDGTKGEAGILLASALCETYLNTTKTDWLDNARKFREYVKAKKLTYPLLIRFVFIRTDNRSFDWLGPLETVQDCMTGHKFLSSLKGIRVTARNNPWAWIPDDDTAHITPDIAGSRIVVDKETAGVIVEVIG